MLLQEVGGAIRITSAPNRGLGEEACCPVNCPVKPANSGFDIAKLLASGSDGGCKRSLGVQTSDGESLQSEADTDGEPDADAPEVTTAALLPAPSPPQLEPLDSNLCGGCCAHAEPSGAADA